MMKKIYLIILLAIALCSCVKEIPVGFLSENIRTREDTLRIVKGMYVTSGFPTIDGSTRPLHFEILNVRNMDTGADAPEFSMSYPVKLWSSPFNPDTDTSMELVNQKLTLRNVPPIEINSVSGQLAFNSGTQNIEGDAYLVDVKISNETSSKIYEDYGKVKLEYRPWETVNNFGEYFYGTVGTNTETAIETRASVGAAEMAQVKKNEHPRYHIKKIGESDEVKVKLSFYDSKDQPFDGKAISKWPKDATYLNCWFDNSIDTKIMSDGVEFNFPTTPFPAFGRVHSSGRESIALSYYFLHPAHYTLTPEAQAIANAKAAELGKQFSAYNLQVKIVYQINEPGIWEVKVKFAHAIKK